LVGTARACAGIHSVHSGINERQLIMRTVACFTLVGLGLVITAASFTASSTSDDAATLAGRYYIRNRTRDFYQRTCSLKSDTVKTSPGDADVFGSEGVSEFDSAKIAGRYYIRNRTRDFYRRATYSSRRRIS
jgi:hypothetical protein